MNIKSLLIVSSLALGGALLTGCGGGGSGSVDVPPPAPPPPPPDVFFSEFVADQFANTADDSDPAPVDGISFDFDVQDDPNAFDDLLPPNP